MTLALLGNYGMDDKIGLINYDIILNSNLNTDISLMERTRDILDNFYQDTKKVLVENKIYLEKKLQRLYWKKKP